MRTFFDGSLRHLSTAFLALLGILVLLAPPISLLDRLDLMPALPGGGGARIQADAGGMIQDDTGAAVIFYPEHVSQDISLDFRNIPLESLTNLRASDRDWQESIENLATAGLTPLSPLYILDVPMDSGAQPVVIRIPLPGDASEREHMKLASWRGDRWHIVPSTLIQAEVLMEAALDTVPSNVLLVKDIATNLSSVTLLLAPDQIPAPSAAAGAVDHAVVNFSRLRGDGGLEGEIHQIQMDTPLLLGIGNIEDNGTIREDLAVNMLLSGGQRQNQITAIREAMEEYGFQGVYLDYRGLARQPNIAPMYTEFVTQLQREMADMDRRVVIRLEIPRQISEYAWDTPGYEWDALGQVADMVVIPAPIDPGAYRPGAFPFESLLHFATNRVARDKLAVSLQADSVAVRSNEYWLRPFSDIVTTMMGQLEVIATEDQTLLMRMNRNYLDTVEYDPNLYQYRFRYNDAELGLLDVHVSDATLLRYKLSILRRHNISHVFMDMTAHTDVDPLTWTVLTEFGDSAPMPDLLPAEYKIEYEVALGNEPKAHLSVPFDNTDKRFPFQEEGTYTVAARLNINGALQQNSISQATIRGQLAARPVAPPADSTAALPEQSLSPALVPGPGSNLVARLSPASNQPIVDTLVNGKAYDIVGRNNDTTWLQLEDEDGLVGWVTTIEVNKFIQNGQRVGGLPVVSVDLTPPTPVRVTPNAPTPLWGYGIQAHVLGQDVARAMQMTRQMDFTWMKQQIRWKDFQKEPNGRIDWPQMDGIVGEADKQGISLLFSVLAAPDWAREAGYDPGVTGPPANSATYAEFVGRVAGRHCNHSLKAIEIWNEQNLHHEWGNLPLDPARYIQMLQAASRSIKEACPSMLVISGALTPSGTNQGPTSRGGTIAVDDLEYLKQMLRGGMLNYVDAVGAHPNGYNVPPTATVSNYCDILRQTGNANFQAGCPSDPHRSFSFRSTMESYRAEIVKYDASKPIWPTEFGWAVDTERRIYPHRGYSLDNNLDEQANWTVEAYRMMKDWGWVAAPILWNLNFRIVAPDTERELWGIVDRHWTPLPVYNSLKAMPK